ncbi:MAG: hypothetical protein BWY45_00989 [Euryarchaeota archaeon ADurb.Bin294]|jgi:hypothetical protein|nr:DUF3821 domain-containing protein [Methanospirillum sp.]MBP9007435.1 DUF3821 domain-containing protein [Methanospirillum sp.]OQA58932.1 MAG: hypothetical protein BWY45_00989 [Euryarchaeota archaeon ADurb.Bin294]
MKYSLAGLFSLLMILFCASQASGDLRTISPGGTVFLGEEGLDISATGVMNGGQIGWWAPGSSRSSDPTELMTVSSPDSFYVSPSAFSGKEGLWYSWPEGSPVFQVKRPQVSVRVYDETADFDATGKWIPRGDAVSFRISSNVYEANSRGGPDGQVDIVLTSPEGAKYSSVSGPSGSFSLSGIPLTSSLTSTGPVWNTGGVTVGTWTVQAELSMNRIKDNMPDTGAGISSPVEVLIQNINPLIKAPVAIEIRTPEPDITPMVTQTTLPAYSAPVTKPITPVQTVETQVQIPAPTFTHVPPPTYTTVQTIEPTPEKTPESTPVPEPTKAPLGILSIIGAGFVLMVLIRP